MRAVNVGKSMRFLGAGLQLLTFYHELLRESYSTVTMQTTESMLGKLVHRPNVSPLFSYHNFAVTSVTSFSKPHGVG